MPFSIFKRREPKHEPLNTIQSNLKNIKEKEEKEEKEEQKKNKKAKSIKKTKNAISLNNNPSNNKNNKKTKKLGFLRRLFGRTKKSVQLTSVNNPDNRNTSSKAREARKAWDSNVSQEGVSPDVRELRELRRNRLSTVVTEPIKRKIKHFWYRGWPDHGAPDLVTDKDRFVSFIDSLYEDITNDKGGTVIHCSAGVGRTGTVFVILKICLERLKTLSQLLLEIDDKKVNKDEIVSQYVIDNAITYARMRRVFMVQDFKQYEFLLKLFGAENKNETNAIFFKDIGSLIVSQLEHETKYGIICKTDNRYQDIKPYDDTIVIIGNKKEEDLKNKNCINYINANYLNKKANINCIEPNKYGEDMHKLCIDKTDIFNGIVIGAQGPIGVEYITKHPGKNNTIQKFLRMLEENNIKRIVMLTGLMEKEVSKCDDYTSGNKNTLTMFETQNSSYNTDFGNFTEYTLKDSDMSSGNLILTVGKLLPIKKKAGQILHISGVTNDSSNTSSHPPRNYNKLFGSLNNSNEI